MPADVNIHSIFAEARKEMPAPKKTATMDFRGRKYQYPTLQDVLDSVMPPLLERGVFLTQRTEVGEGMLLMVTEAHLGAECAVLDKEPYAYSENPQDMGKAETYARRYSLSKVFGLQGDPDTDGAKDSPKRSDDSVSQAKRALNGVIQLGVSDNGWDYGSVITMVTGSRENDGSAEYFLRCKDKLSKCYEEQREPEL